MTEPDLESNEEFQTDKLKPAVLSGQGVPLNPATEGAVRACEEERGSLTLPETAQEEDSIDDNHDCDEHDETTDILTGTAVESNSCGTQTILYNRPQKRPCEASGTAKQDSPVPSVRTSECCACDERFKALTALKAHRCRAVLPEGDTKMFRCGICKESFQLFNSLRLHMTKFHKRWRCKHAGCRASFSSSSEFIEHKQSHQNNTCEVCGKMFSSSKWLRRHQQVHTLSNLGGSAEKNVMCHICSKMFATRAILVHHLRSHQTDRPVKCPQCTKTFKIKSDLTRHMRSHLTEYNIQCDQCSAKFNHKYALRNHIHYVHTKHKLYVCSRCNSSFHNPGNLKRHMKIHTGEKPYACKHCAASFTQKENLNSHIASIHDKEKKTKGPSGGGSADTAREESSVTDSAVELPGEAEADAESGKKFPYRCELCGKQYSTFNYFQKHKDSHTALPVLDDPLVCPICGKRLSAPNVCAAHIRMHTGETPFQCDQCPKAFPSKCQLKSHLVSHLTELNVHCDQCSARFTCERSRKSHVKFVHSTARPFACSQCQATFKCFQNLSRHMSVHTGERRYQCDQCPRTFIQKINMKNPLKTHDKTGRRTSSTKGQNSELI